MVTLDGEVLVLDRSQEGDDVLPLVHLGKGRDRGWYIDIGIEDEAALNRLIDAEILDEDLPIRYIARNGAAAEAQAYVMELISGPEGHLCRLRGRGPAPAAFTADEPREI